MTYERSLAAELRYRGFPEHKIAEVLAEVRAHTPPGEDPALHFGAPETYAAQYADQLPAGRTTSPVLVAAAVLALLYAVFALLVMPLLGLDITNYTGPVRLWPALAVLAVGVISSFLRATYRRVPHQIRQES